MPACSELEYLRNASFIRNVSTNMVSTLIGTRGARVLRDDGVQAQGLPVPLVGLRGRGHPPADLPNIGGSEVMIERQTSSKDLQLVQGVPSPCRPGFG